MSRIGAENYDVFYKILKKSKFVPLNVVMKQDVVIFISYKLNLLLLHKTKRLELLMVMRTDSNAQKLQSQILPGFSSKNHGRPSPLQRSPSVMLSPKYNNFSWWKFICYS